MSLAISFARASRRRRRFSPTSILESLERRELLTVAVMAPVTVAVSSVHDLHAQFLRLQQLHGLQTGHQVAAAATHVTSTHVTSTHATSTLAAAIHKASVQRAHTAAAAVKHPFNDFVVYSPTGTTASDDGDGAQATYSPVVGAYTPAQVRTAYGVSSLSLANQGQGTTIAIVDEFDDPNIISDANVFSAQYNLPQFDGLNGDPTLTVMKDQDLGIVTSAVGTGVAGETSLDVEWAHAMAPKANIVLVEVPATVSVANEFAQLLEGVQFGAKLPGVVAVSLSYGYPEANIGAANVIAQNSAYLATGAAANVAVTVSTGDGSTPLFPAVSPNVIGVGGTSLYFSSVRGKYAYETAWGGLASAGAGGGGLSTNFAAPTYQSSNGVSYATRAIPDVALIADPVTAVSYYDTLDVTTSAPDPWGAVGGTSLAAPVFAGMVDLAQQDRIAIGAPILNSAQINSEIYSVYNSPSYSTYFHDINQGNNSNVNSRGRTTVAGYTATTGYDLATGVGSPIGSTFVPLLASL